MSDIQTVKLDRDYPCWSCGQHYITVASEVDKGNRRRTEVTCPDCGKIGDFYRFTLSDVEQEIMEKVMKIPRDKDKREKYFAKAHFITQCHKNIGKEEIWSFEGENICYGADFSITPTSCDGVKTLYIQSSGDEYGGYMTPENARELRDALNRWLDE